MHVCMSMCISFHYSSTSRHFDCSELGVVRWFFTLVRLYHEKFNADRATEITKTLSRRVAAALREMGLPPVHRIFEKKHGSITGAQYRCVSARVMLAVYLRIGQGCNSDAPH